MQGSTVLHLSCSKATVHALPCGTLLGIRSYSSEYTLLWNRQIVHTYCGAWWRRECVQTVWWKSWFLVPSFLVDFFFMCFYTYEVNSPYSICSCPESLLSYILFCGLLLYCIDKFLLLWDSLKLSQSYLSTIWHCCQLMCLTGLLWSHSWKLLRSFL